MQPLLPTKWIALFKCAINLALRYICSLGPILAQSILSLWLVFLM